MSYCTLHIYVVLGFWLHFSGVRRAVYVVVRLMFGAVGFHRVRTVGEQATRQEAPVLAVAPHSSFYDGLAAVVTGGPTIVAKEENSSIPIVGSTPTTTTTTSANITLHFARVVIVAVDIILTLNCARCARIDYTRGLDLRFDPSRTFCMSFRSSRSTCRRARV